MKLYALALLLLAGTAHAAVPDLIFANGFELSVPVACVSGTPADIQGYRTVCAGFYKLHSGGADKQVGPAPYSFKFVWGRNVSDWPGAGFGSSQIFTTGMHDVLAVPFQPSPGHTISINENQTWTQRPITFVVATKPGVFGHGVKDDSLGIICAGTNNPALKLSSNGSTTTQCKLNTNTVYWFNIVPAKYSEAAGLWINSFSPPTAQFATTIYLTN